ncbi:MAG: 4Fe-4S binding protein [Peptococcaceae bacterium]|nr:4Fe-4S binding protein [Peptococcaceae bacterium]MDH7525492.1 4Fe-4S binding protein [Peptococcaceae bacterium]
MIKYIIDIRKDWCKACGICVDFCPNGVLGFDPDGKAAVLDIERCTGCMMCEYRCPDYAIKISHYGKI